MLIGAAPVGSAATTAAQAEIAGILECDTAVYASGVLAGPEDGGSKSPQEALAAMYRGPGRALPVHGYDLLERSAETALFAYRNSGRVRAAVRVERNAKTLDGSLPADRWTWTAFAGCDPVEFAPSADDEIGIGLVRSAEGTRLPARLIHQRPTEPHCEPGVWSLVLGRMVPSYIRDPKHEVTAELLVPYEGDTRLPPTAVDTGLRTGAFFLFADADVRAIYAVGPKHVERWPARLPSLLPGACG